MEIVNNARVKNVIWLDRFKFKSVYKSVKINIIPARWRYYINANE